MIICPICKNDTFESQIHLKDYSISKEEFEIRRCSNCKFQITFPQPTSEKLPDYYKSENYISHSATKKGWINKAYHSVQKINLNNKFKTIYKHVPRGTWMDYGAGNGPFVEYLNNKNIEAVGYEPDDTARRVALERNVKLIPTSQYQPQSHTYSAITMWHVLEHIPNLNEILQIHSSNLIQNGILAIAVPNPKSWDAKFYKKFWAAYDVPRHLWHFEEKHVKDLVEKHNFEHLKTKPLIYDAYYVSLLSEKYKKGFLPRAILIAAISNLKARFTSRPYSSQIYIFRKKGD